MHTLIHRQMYARNVNLGKFRASRARDQEPFCRSRVTRGHRDPPDAKDAERHWRGGRVNLDLRTEREQNRRKQKDKPRVFDSGELIINVKRIRVDQAFESRDFKGLVDVARVHIVHGDCDRWAQVRDLEEKRNDCVCRVMGMHAIKNNPPPLALTAHARTHARTHARAYTPPHTQDHDLMW